MNSQITDERKVQLFTTYRGNLYDDPNINIKDLGNLNFTYSSMTKPTVIDTLNSFTSGYIEIFLEIFQIKMLLRHLILQQILYLDLH